MSHMNKGILGILMASLLMIGLAACGDNDNVENDTENGNEKNTAESADEPLQVVSSIAIIADIAEELGGDLVDVYSLVPIGTDPHEYEPLPEDNKQVTDADILFYNGLNLEGGKEGWFFKLIDSVGQDEDNVFSVTEQVEPLYIGGDKEGIEEEINPHSFIDPYVGVMMVEDMRDVFVEVDPDNEEQYRENADDYINQLEDIIGEYEEKIDEIPKENRILVTSERAYQYLADRFGLEEGYIWEVGTEENGSPEQIKSLVNKLEETDVPHLFVESNVDERPMETVSNEADIPIYEKPIFSEDIGDEDGEVDTYIKYLNYNIDAISEGLNP